MYRSTAPRVIFFFTSVLLVAVSVTAAPAPVYRPNTKPSTPWVTGWDKPVDALGDCRFTKKGDNLRIFVPAGAHDIHQEFKQTTAPYMLRDIEGDFDVQVRVEGRFDQANPLKAESVGAGILITDGSTSFRFGRGGNQNNDLILNVSMQNRGGTAGSQEAGCVLKPVYLRVERRKNILTVKYRIDRPNWWVPFEGHPPFVVALPKKLKVGVYAASAAPAVFEPIFDQFALSPAK